MWTDSNAPVPPCARCGNSKPLALRHDRPGGPRLGTHETARSSRPRGGVFSLACNDGRTSMLKSLNDRSRPLGRHLRQLSRLAIGRRRARTAGRLRASGAGRTGGRLARAALSLRHPGRFHPVRADAAGRRAVPPPHAVRGADRTGGHPGLQARLHRLQGRRRAWPASSATCSTSGWCSPTCSCC